MLGERGNSGTLYENSLGKAVPRRKAAPRWVTREMLVAIHAAQLDEHGGSNGVRDEGLLDSALARARNKFEYSPDADLADLAAACAYGIARNHPFVDGNKRSAFMATYVFAGLNDHEFDADEADVVVTIERLAAGRVTESQFAAWIRSRLRAI